MRSSRIWAGFGFGLVVVLAVELACWESFLSAARPFGEPLPVSAVLALVGNVVVGGAGARTLGRVGGAVVPGVLWLGIALVLGTGTSSGDVVVAENGRGIAFLIAGAAGAAAAVALAGGRPAQAPKPGASP